MRNKLFTALIVMAVSSVMLFAQGKRAIDQNVNPAFAIEKNGKVVFNGKTYNSMVDYQLSNEFKTQGMRCKQIAPGEDLFKAASDCTTGQTVIQGEYYISETYTIPVVFHVIMDSNGNGAISDALIQSQLDILNEDFGALPGTPGSPGFDSGIRFTLAGITRTTNTTWYNDNQESTYKSQLGWDRDTYLNVYTNTASGYLGYAYFPQDMAGQNLDGVVLNHTAVGRNAPNGGVYDQGRTATHEIGHYLGLYHTFQGGCSNSYTSGDLIVDTNAETTARYDCNNYSSCGSTDPIHNYMDYTNDTCMDHFTAEQANRMVCSLVNYRPSLYSVSGGNGNNSPQASFSFNASDLSVSFDGSASSDSDGSIVSYSWNFGDGSSASGATASHTYAASGSYNVTLTVTDNEGATGSQTQSVTVSSSTGGNTQTATVSGSLRRNASDYYTLTVSGGVIELSCAFDGSRSRDIDIYLRAPNGNLVATADGYDNPEVIVYNTNGTAGTYEIQVRNRTRRTTSYDLTATWQE